MEKIDDNDFFEGITFLGGRQSDPANPLTPDELQYMFESEEIDALETPAEVYAESSAISGGKKYHGLCVEFHFRNDATRHMWEGWPVTYYEEDLPLPEVVEPVAERCLAVVKKKALEFGGITMLDKTGYIEQEDRYALWVFIPFDWIKAKFANSDDYMKFIMTLLL